MKMSLCQIEIKVNYFRRAAIRFMMYHNANINGKIITISDFISLCAKVAIAFNFQHFCMEKMEEIG